MKKFIYPLFLLLFLSFAVPVFADYDYAFRGVEGELVQLASVEKETQKSVEDLRLAKTNSYVLGVAGGGDLCPSAAFQRNWDGAADPCTGNFPDPLGAEIGSNMSVASNAVEVLVDSDGNFACNNPGTTSDVADFYATVEFTIKTSIDIGNQDDYSSFIQFRNSDGDRLTLVVKAEDDATGDIDEVYLICPTDGGNAPQQIAWIPNPDQAYEFDIHFKVATGVGQNDGICQFRIDDGSWNGTVVSDSDTISDMGEGIYVGTLANDLLWTSSFTYILDNVEMRGDSSFCYD